MRPVTYSLLPEFGSVQSSDVNMGGRLGSQYALLRSSPWPTKSFSTVKGIRIVGVKAPLAKSGPRATGMLIYYLE